MDADKIVKQIHLNASRDRVWRAISNSDEFGYWFGMKFDGPFVAGQTIRGTIVTTKVDPAVAQGQKPYEGLPFEIIIERIEPEHLLSFRWHPHAVDPTQDYSAEPMTLVEFKLEDDNGGVLLTVTESGFDQIPIERRAKAFQANEGGWTVVVTLVEKYLAHAG